MEIKFLNVSYKDEINQKVILKNLSFKIGSNTIVGFIGPDGSGKSSLFEYINNLTLPDEGYIFFNDKPLHPKSYLKYKNKLGMVYQEPDKHFMGKTIDEVFTLRLLNYRGNKTKRIHDSLKMVGLDYHKLSPFISKLSLSEKRKLSLALVLASNPDIILLDEALLDIDKTGKEVIPFIFKRQKICFIILIF